jgi:hypothetical protein
MQLHTPRAPGPRARTLRLGAAAALLATAAAGCAGGSGGDEAPDGGAGAGPTTTVAAGGSTVPDGAADATTTTVNEAADTLEDGRHPVRIVAVSDGDKTVRFDLIQFLTGEAANKAAAEDGEESPPPNDYYIRNVNPKLRTLAIAPSATVTVNVLAAGDTGSSVKDTKITLAKLAGYPRDRVRDAVFWLTVSHGKVTRIEEQFVP